MANPIENNLIKQAEAKNEEQLHPQDRDAYSKIVVAGMRTALNGGDKSLLASLKTSQNPLQDIVKGAIGIVGVLRRQSNGNMPVKPMILGAWTLVLHGLDFAERVGVLKVDKNVLAQANQMFSDTLLPLMGVTKQKLAMLGQKVHGIMSNPQQAARIRQELIKQHQPQANPQAAQPAQP